MENSLTMRTSRMEAFSDGVLAIVITIMVLELKAPHEHEIESLVPLIPTGLSYLLSFLYLAIYWNNHHHLLQASKEVDGRVLWFNMNLLFWWSLVPFATAWVGESGFAAWPVAVYGGVLAIASASYYALARQLTRLHGEHSALAVALGGDLKERLSPLLYASAVPVALFLSPWLAYAIVVATTALWFVPDRRIESILD